MVNDDSVFPEHQAATVTFDRIAEQSVLGAMMLNVEAVWHVAGVLAPGDFFDPRHEIIMRAIMALAHSHKPVEPLAVVQELERTGDIEKAGGAPYIMEVYGTPTTWSNASFYADIVLDKAVRRGLIQAGETIASYGRSGQGDAFDHVEQARAKVDSLTSFSRVEIRSIGESFMGLVESLSEPPRFIPTQWPDLNKHIGGLRPGKLYIIGARPTRGKSIMALQLAQTMGYYGAVAFASLEMSEEDLQKRMISTFAEVPLSSLMNSQLTPDEWKRVAANQKKIITAPIFIDDKADVTVTGIKSFARSVSRRHNLSGIIVDYLQLMVSPGRDRDRSRQEVVAEFSRQLKMLAKELDVPVVALSQLNRAPEGRRGGKPSMADLRESGAIEQDADAVILLHHEADNPKRRGILEVIVEKNRHGTTGSLELRWEGEYARVLPMVERQWRSTLDGV